jgi:uncharacterized protein (TIGR02596 family)
MKISPSRTLRNLRAFSLVELLVVIGVIAVLMVLSAPSMSAAFKGSKLTQGGEAFRNLINQGRQMALKNNLPVEVRIFKYDDLETPEETSYYMAARLYLMRLNLGSNNDPMTSELKEEAVGNLLKLPAGIILSDDVQQSSLIDPSKVISGKGNVKGIDPDQTEKEAEYVAFQIRPDGSLNLPSTQRWFLTLYNREEIIRGKQSTPSDYVCLQVNPYTCDVRWYHPN